jgi:excisionase family DNA binding protein
MPAPLRAPRRLTVDEAAARLGTTTRTIWRLVNRGELDLEKPSPGRSFISEESVARLERRRARKAAAC